MILYNSPVSKVTSIIMCYLSILIHLFSQIFLWNSFLKQVPEWYVMWSLYIVSGKKQYFGREWDSWISDLLSFLPIYTLNIL